MAEEEPNGYSWEQRKNRRRTHPPVTPILPVPSRAGKAGRALANEVALVAGATEGTRNTTLNTAAFNLGQLVAGGSLDFVEVTEQLSQAGTMAGLDPREIGPTIRSGLSKGIEHPRTVTDPPERVEEVAVVTLQGVPDDPLGEERTSWWAVSLLVRVAQDAAVPHPTHLLRDDDVALLYAGKVNGLIGESESGKSWVLLLAVAQALVAGELVLLLDFEDAPPGIAARLRAMGVPDECLERLHYAAPAEALGVLQATDLAEVLSRGYTLIGVDGVNAAMTLLGYDLNSNTDATLFFTRLLRPMAATGATVATVDHVPKNVDARGKGGIGAQAKRAMMDGCCLLVEVVEPFGKGQNGILRLKVDKDRPGVVRGVSASSVLAGRVLLTSHDNGSLTLHIAAPDLRSEEERSFAPIRRTGLMEKISRCLERVEKLGQNELVTEIGSKRDYVREALGSLVSEGFVMATDAPRKGTWYFSQAAYRQATDPGSDMFSKDWAPLGPTEPPLSPGVHSATEPPDPPLRRRGAQSAGPSGTGDWTPTGEVLCDGGCGQLVAPYLLDSDGFCRDCARRLDR